MSSRSLRECQGNPEDLLRRFEPEQPLLPFRGISTGNLTAACPGERLFSLPCACLRQAAACVRWRCAATGKVPRGGPACDEGMGAGIFSHVITTRAEGNGASEGIARQALPLT